MPWDIEKLNYVNVMCKIWNYFLFISDNMEVDYEQLLMLAEVLWL